jgi:pyridoxine 5-phosphate synthase
MIRLGVAIDHVATLRTARAGSVPDPVEAALIAERSGADAILCHLREPVREADVERLRKRVIQLTLYCGSSPREGATALRAKPHQVTLVPRQPAERTAGGGLDVRRRLSNVKKLVERFGMAGIEVCLSIDPDLRQVAAARRAGAGLIELHAGAYSAAPPSQRRWERQKLIAAARTARREGFEVAAGHGIDYENVTALAAIREIEQVNVGFAIVANALFLGLSGAVRHMKELMVEARR